MPTSSQEWNNHILQLVEEGFDAQEATEEAMRRFPSSYVKAMSAAGMSNGAIVSRLAGVTANSPPFKVRTKK